MNDYQTPNPDPSGKVNAKVLFFKTLNMPEYESKYALVVDGLFSPAECAWMLQEAIESTRSHKHNIASTDESTQNLESKMVEPNGLAQPLPTSPPPNSTDHPDETHDVSPNPWQVADLNGGSKQAYTNTNLRNSSRIILDSHGMADWIFARLKPYILDIEMLKGANMHHSVNRSEWERAKDGLLAKTTRQSGENGDGQPMESTTTGSSGRESSPGDTSTSNLSLGAKTGPAEPGHTVNVKGKIARIRKNLLNGAPTDTLASSVDPIPSGVAPSAVLTRINERLRFLKYTPGQYFNPHFDGCYFTGDKAEMSYVTLQIYLNGPVGSEDGSEAPGFNFVDPESTPHQSNPLKGGATRFFSHRALLKGKDGAPGGAYYDVEPRMGRVLIFEQDGLIHSGEEVTSGVKYTMRTDFMYRLEG